MGVASLRELIASRDEQTLGEIMRTNVRYVNANTDQEEVANVVQKYDFLALPVVDNDEKIARNYHL